MSYDAQLTHASVLDTKEMVKIRLQHTIKGVRALLESGCTSSKIYIGVPFYATSLDHPGQVKTIADALGDDSLADATVTDIAASLRARFVGYQWDSPAVIRLKMEMVKKYDLGGIFAWELGHDLHTSRAISAGGLLLSAISAASGPPRASSKAQTSTSDGTLSEMEL